MMSDHTNSIPTFDDVLAAHERIKPYIHKTPVLTSRFLNELTGAELFFKCENFQKAGAFKVRGACNAVFGLSDEKAVIGVATHSSGNHALSLSYAAGRRGIPVTVVMPHTAPRRKRTRCAAMAVKLSSANRPPAPAKRCLLKWWPPPASTLCTPITTPG